MPKTPRRAVTKAASLTGAAMWIGWVSAKSAGSYRVAGLVHRSLNGGKVDVGLAGDVEFAARQIDPNIGDARDCADLFGDRCDAMAAVHTAHDILGLD